jgi:hypothetical protein
VLSPDLKNYVDDIILEGKISDSFSKNEKINQLFNDIMMQPD